MHSQIPFAATGLLIGLLHPYGASLQPRPDSALRTMDFGDHKHGNRERGAPDIAALLVGCAQQNATAFQRLYEMQSSRLYGLALRITRQPGLAADAVHDALLQVWRQSARFDPERGSAEAWLFALVRYRVLDIARRRIREVPDTAMPERVDDEPGPLDRLMGTRDGEALRRCLEQVDADRRRLVLLAFVDGLTHSELAAQVRQPLGTVKSSIRRALLALRDCLGGPSAREDLL